MRELTLDALLSRVDQLPEVPQIAFKVIHLLNNPDLEVSDLADVIGTDQALTAKILRLCNSAFYGLQRRVTTISEAVTILGFNTIKSMVMMITTKGAMNKGLLGYRMGAGELWDHSLGTAEVARFLATKIDYNPPEEAFVAGLLHDLGKVILNQHALTEVYKATSLQQLRNMPLDEAEREILTFDHAQAGAGLAEKWNFPQQLVDAIRMHHTVLRDFNNLDTEELGILPILVSLANILVNMFSENNENAYEIFSIYRNVIEETVGITDSMLPSLLPELKEHVSEVNKLALAIA